MLVRNNLFVPEGHCSCILWERTAKDSKEKSVGIASVGGARHTEPSTWELGNSLTVMEFLVSDNDVAVNSCGVFGPNKMRGSSLVPLQGSTLINVQSNSLPEKYVTFVTQNKY